MAKKAKVKAEETAGDPKKEALSKLNEAKSALTAYLKKNKLKRSDDHSEDKKHGSKIAKLEKAIEKAQAAYEKLKAPSKKKDKGAKKESAGRRTKYDYPADIVSADDRKKYRQKMRAEAKAAGKGEKKSKKAKTGKPKADKAEGKKTSKKAKTGKKSKKSKKDD